MTQHLSPISGIDTFAQLVATAGYDNQLILWDAGRRVIAGARHDHLVNQCRFSPSGRLLVTAASDNTARVWSVPSLTPVALLDGHRDDVEMAAFSPDERRVATASRDHMVRIFDAASGALQACLAGHHADVISVEWAADGAELVSSGDDGTIRRFSAHSGALLDTIDLGGVEADTVACGPGGMVFVGTDHGDIVTLGGPRHQHGRHVTQGHASGIKRLVFQASTGTLLSASYDRLVKLWQVQRDGALVLLQAFSAPPAVWLRCAAFVDRSAILFGSFGSSWARYDRHTQQWDLAGIEDTPGANAVRQFGGAVYTVGDAGVVRRNGMPVRRLGSLCNFLVEYDGRLLTGGHLGQLFDALSGEILYSHHSPLNCGAAFVRKGVAHVAIGCYTGECIVLCHGEGRTLDPVEVLHPHDNAVKGIAANGSHLFTVCATGAAAFTAIGSYTRQRLVPAAHDKISNGAALLPDGGFASVSRDRSLRLWRGEQMRRIATPHTHSIKCVAVCPRTGLIATGAYNGLLAIYDEHADAWLKVEQPTRSGISSLTPGRQPGTFLASSYDGQVYALADCLHPEVA